jgi:hypothetical protein
MTAPRGALGALLVGAIACGGGGGGGYTAGDGGILPGDGGGSGFHPAAHPALPQVVTFGGQVLAAPRVQPIVYASDADRAAIGAFFQEQTVTGYWAAVTSEYGVGRLTVLPAIELPEAPPPSIDDATLTQRLVGSVSGPSPAWGAADPGTIYVFALPAGTIGTARGGSCCSDFDGYHDEVAVAGGARATYAVGCTCPAASGPGATSLQRRTGALSHELVEAATDPRPRSALAYAQEDDADVVWTLVTGGELADLCEVVGPTLIIPRGATYAVQRSWSNAAARAGGDPCVPHTGAALYLNSYTSFTDTLDVPGQGSSIATDGVALAVGQKKTVDVHLFSTAATTGTWTVTAIDAAEALGTGPARLALALDRSTGANGDTLHLDITARSFDATLGSAAFLLVSTYGKPGDADYQRTVSMGLVAPR